MKMGKEANMIKAVKWLLKMIKIEIKTGLELMT
jgi:hypothetical protein